MKKSNQQKVSKLALGLYIFIIFYVSDDRVFCL